MASFVRHFCHDLGGVSFAIHPLYPIRSSVVQPQIARCPRHAIQFMNYGYGEYVEQVLELAGIDAARMELRQYELWTPYQFASPHDRLQGTAKDEP
jgi:hypothetical protein